MTTAILPVELVVDILSRLPLKSFCRFKCVCKSWLAFSFHPYYRQKLPRTPAGLLYRKREPDGLSWLLGTDILLARLPASDRDIDTRLDFVPPSYKYSNLQDCSNGLLLCYQRGDKREEISNAIVCNLATKEWMAIADTEPRPHVCSTDLKLCFDPLWSQHFYVFKFQSIRQGTSTKVEVFFSENSSWSGCLWEAKLTSFDDSLFVNGVLYLMYSWDHQIMAFDAPDTNSQRLNHRIIQLPGFTNWPGMFLNSDECLSQSLGVLCYAKKEHDGRAVQIWSLEGPDEWVMKHRVSMTDVFGRDVLISSVGVFRYFDYDILAFDLERELVILADMKADKIFLVSISTGKASYFPNLPEKFTELHNSLLYAPYYGKIPALVR